jgi:hypothetical protein
VKAETIETGIRKANDELLVLISKEAGDAKSSAEAAAAAAQRAKDIADAVAKQQGSIAKSQAETERAQRDFRADIETVNGRMVDRRLDGKNLVKLLEGKPKKRGLILYNPYDAEAWNLSLHISWFLGDGPSKDEPGAGWTVLPLATVPPDAGIEERFATSLSRSGFFFIAKDIFHISDTNSPLGALNNALVQSVFPRKISSSSQRGERPNTPERSNRGHSGPTWWWEFEAFRSNQASKAKTPKK